MNGVILNQEDFEDLHFAVKAALEWYEMILMQEGWTFGVSHDHVQNVLKTKRRLIRALRIVRQLKSGEL